MVSQPHQDARHEQLRSSPMREHSDTSRSRTAILAFLTAPHDAGGHQRVIISHDGVLESCCPAKDRGRPMPRFPHSSICPSRLPPQASSPPLRLPRSLLPQHLARRHEPAASQPTTLKPSQDDHPQKQVTARRTNPSEDSRGWKAKPVERPI